MTNTSPGKQVWKRLKRNKTAMTSMGVIFLVSFIAVFCFLLMPDRTPMANRMCLPISNQPPGFKVKMLRVHSGSVPEKQGFFSRIFTGKRTNEEWIAIGNYRFEENDIVV